VSRNLVESVLGPQWIRVRLQNPPHNGLTPELCHQLHQVLVAASDNPEIRAILLDSQGSSFCVGADLRWAAQQQIGSLSQLVRAMHLVCEVLLTAPKPVICAVGGVAAGGGISMDGGSTLRLPQLVGLGKTQGLLYDDRTLGASEARDLGLVHEVVHPDRLEEQAWKRLESLAQGPTLAFGESKRLLNPPERVREVLDRETEAIDRIVQTQDARNAMLAFLEKRAPHYEGR
jgi:2-(1,2-epoxy-1,2-dihydrophenyl)acetyl-CoA isomerase